MASTPRDAPRVSVALVGMMGSGKSTVGKRLGRLLGMPVIDTDSLVERRSGRSIADVFRDDGEDEFRRLEAEAVRSACESGPCVIATGGGVVTNPELVDELRRSAEVIYLRAAPGALASKLPPGKAQNSRPMLGGAASGAGGAPVEAELARLLAERSAAYESAADLIVDVDELPFETVADVIARWLAGDEDD